VLVVRAGALGDLLLLRPVLAALRAAGQALTLLSPSAGRVLLGPDGIDTWLDWEAREAAAWMAGRAPEPGPWRDAITACARALVYTRAPEWPAALSALGLHVVTHAPAPPSADARHAALWLAEPLAAWGLEAPASAAPLRYLPAELEAVAHLRARLPRHFLALHAGSGSAAKNWPHERFLALAERLAPGAPFLLVRGPAERHQPTLDTARVVLAQDLPLRQLGALLGQAEFYVGNDSGVSHLAAASGAACLVLFGPTDPAVWRPLGQVVTLRAEAGLDALEVEQVAKAGAISAARLRRIGPS
jgi:ADP-heptose:LPS heptosyltransferase